jgi:predicted nuclease with TOPRIM domain
MQENARLQAEVERLRNLGIKLESMIDLLVSENASLKADVNELADGLKLASEVGIKMADEVTRLKAEVERLTKMCQATSPDGFIHIRDIKHLNAAKGGKQS